VRHWDSGFFEGSWAGPAEPWAIPASTTVFGSGIVRDADGGTIVVTPSHTMSGVFASSGERGAKVSNSLTALLAATGAELLRDGDYPPRFIKTMEGVGHS